jgi:hypothetical protein
MSDTAEFDAFYNATNRRSRWDIAGTALNRLPSRRAG